MDSEHRGLQGGVTGEVDGDAVALVDEAAPQGAVSAGTAAHGPVMGRHQGDAQPGPLMALATSPAPIG